jgi:hypothetical protein
MRVIIGGVEESEGAHLVNPDIDSPDIDGGTIDGATINDSPIGGTTPAAGAFTTLKADLIEMKKGADIASASPLPIGTDGDYFDVTGTTGFAAMTVVANRHFFLQFDAILTMTHHATNLDLPGEANITTAAGDVGEFFSTGANTVQCVGFVKASGYAVKTELSEDPSPQLGANLNKSTFGIMENITSHSATEAVTAATMYGNIHKITGAYTLTLPAAVIGMSGIFRATTAAVFSIKAGAGCHFEMIDGTVLDNGDKQTSGGTKNAWLHIHCETANVWITSGQHGTMEDTGA